MNRARVHPLLQHHPVVGQRATSAGDAPAPYRIEDGLALLIGGTTIATATRALLAPEHAAPVLDSEGRALAALWLIQATQASHGPHHEAQVSLAVTRDARPPVAAHPLALLQVLAEGNAAMLCHGLWNDSPLVVAYNREILGLNPQTMEASFSKAPGRIDATCIVRKPPDPEPLVLAQVRSLRRTSLRATAAMAQRMGVRRLARMASKPWQESFVINRRGILPTNMAARACIAGTSVGLDLWDPARDRLTLAAEPYHYLEFIPQFVEVFHGLKFVYMEPESWTEGDPTP